MRSYFVVHLAEMTEGLCYACKALWHPSMFHLLFHRPMEPLYLPLRLGVPYGAVDEFDASEFTNPRRLMIRSIVDAESSTPSLFSNSRSFGPDHPYSCRSSTTQSSIISGVLFGEFFGRRDRSDNEENPDSLNLLSHLCPVFLLTPYSRHNRLMLSSPLRTLATNSTLSLSTSVSFQGISHLRINSEVCLNV